MQVQGPASVTDETHLASGRLLRRCTRRVQRSTPRGSITTSGGGTGVFAAGTHEVLDLLCGSMLCCCCRGSVGLWLGGQRRGAGDGEGGRGEVEEGVVNMLNVVV